MIPKAKMDALLKEPPRNVFNKSNIPPWAPSSRISGLIPGKTIKDPSLKIIKKPMVFKILTRRSSIEKIFFMVVKNFFIITGV